jgi:hypothetical protein
MFIQKGENVPKKVSRPLAIATALVAAAFGAFVAPAPASAYWSCGRAAPPDLDTTGNHRNLAYANVWTYVGSSTRCAQDYWLQRSFELDYHCWAHDYDNPGLSWTYVVTVGGAKRGWLPDRQLGDGGSSVRCPGA